MAGAVQRNERFAIVVLVNGWHSAGVADNARVLYAVDSCCILDFTKESGFLASHLNNRLINPMFLF